jgi:hypothetical protein
MIIHQTDVNTAFLNANLEKAIYMLLLAHPRWSFARIEKEFVRFEAVTI